MKALVAASRKAAEREKRRVLLVTLSAIAAALVLAVLSAFAFQQTGNARRAEAAAIAEKERADEAAKKAESAAQAGLLNETISLAALSRAALLEGRPADAVKRCWRHGRAMAKIHARLCSARLRPLAKPCRKCTNACASRA